MINFSESNEYTREMAGRIGVVKVFEGMLHRAPTPTEVTLWRRADLAELIEHTLFSAEYASRVDGG